MSVNRWAKWGEKNNRRCELIDKEINGTISGEEKEELESLQRDLYEYKKEKAPRPLEEILKLHEHVQNNIREIKKDLQG